jgi:SAM-dependent methyltransferase
MDRMAIPEKIDEQYTDPRKLTARQSLWRHLPGAPLADRVVGLVPSGAVVADVGCGNGVYLERLRRRGRNPTVVGFDLSAGMARAALAHAPTAVADAQALPLRDASVDVVLCLHMLYHVPDIARAVRELRRVLRPGGRVLVTTNGAGHTAELKAVMDDAARWVAGTGVDPDRDLRRFDTEGAKAMLAEEFDDVAVVPAGGSSVVTDAATILDYLASWPPSAVGIADGPIWTEVLREASRTVLAHFAQSQTFTVTSAAAILIGRVPAATTAPVKPPPARGPAQPGTPHTG